MKIFITWGVIILAGVVIACTLFVGMMLSITESMPACPEPQELRRPGAAEHDARLAQARADLEMSQDIMRDYQEGGRRDLAKQQAEVEKLRKRACKAGQIEAVYCD